MSIPCEACCREDASAHSEELQVASRDQLGKMSVKAQPCRCIRHLINLRVHQAKRLACVDRVCVSGCVVLCMFMSRSICSSVGYDSVQHLKCSSAFSDINAHNMHDTHAQNARSPTKRQS